MGERQYYNKVTWEIIKVAQFIGGAQRRPGGSEKLPRVGNITGGFERELDEEGDPGKGNSDASVIWRVGRGRQGGRTT